MSNKDISETLSDKLSHLPSELSAELPGGGSDCMSCLERALSNLPDACRLCSVLQISSFHELIPMCVCVWGDFHDAAVSESFLLVYLTPHSYSYE